jgi:hypothetical protein
MAPGETNVTAATATIIISTSESLNTFQLFIGVRSLPQLP